MQSNAIVQCVYQHWHTQRNANDDLDRCQSAFAAVWQRSLGLKATRSSSRSITSACKALSRCAAPLSRVCSGGAARGDARPCQRCLAATLTRLLMQRRTYQLPRLPSARRPALKPPAAHRGGGARGGRGDGRARARGGRRPRAAAAAGGRLHGAGAGALLAALGFTLIAWPVYEALWAGAAFMERVQVRRWQLPGRQRSARLGGCALRTRAHKPASAGAPRPAHGPTPSQAVLCPKPA